jgi:cell division protein ZapA
MPQVEITIGGRSFEVACQEGEEPYLRSAAAMLDAEATALSAQIGRMPEARMLLMAGLMLADKTAGLEERLRETEDRVAELLARIDRMQEAPVQTEVREVVETVEIRVEVPVVPEALVVRLAELAADAEALAEKAEALAG